MHQSRYGVSDYQKLIAAREFVRQKIATDCRDMDYRTQSPLDDKAQLMRVYGYLANLDEQIARIESQAFSEWRNDNAGTQ